MKCRSVLLGATLLLSANTAFADFQADLYQAGGAAQVRNLTEADALIAGATAPTDSETQAVVNYFFTNGGGVSPNNNGAFGSGNNPFPGNATLVGVSATNPNVVEFAMRATCDVVIPTAGDYTFGINTNDVG